MKIFDWIPTGEEIFYFMACRLVGHDWVRRQRGGSPVEPDSTEVVEYCTVCGKMKP